MPTWVFNAFFIRGLVVYERPSMLAAPISSYSFLGFDYVFSVQVWYICLNSVGLSQKKYILFIQNWI